MEFKKDNSCINQIKGGDSSAYSYLVNKYKKMVFNVAYQLLENYEDAEEAAQDAFLKAYKALDTYRGDAKFSTWIYRITYNTAISRLRKKKLPISSTQENVALTEGVSDTQLSINELRKKEQKEYINKAFNKLDNEDKVILTLFYLEEKSVDEIRDITGLNKSNIKIKLHRTRKKMYVELYHLLQDDIKSIL